MKLNLNGLYSRNEIDRFLAKRSATTVVGNNFFVGSDILVCIFNATEEHQTLFFESPSDLIWLPRPNSPEALVLKSCCLPEPLETAFLKQTYRRLIFATEDQHQYQFLGKIGLTYVARRPSADYVASFFLTPKLEVMSWSRYGGKHDWQLVINGRFAKLDRNARIEEALEPEWNTSVVDAVLTRYQEDCLHLIANDDSAVVTYIDRSRGIGLCSLNRQYIGSSQSLISLTGYDHADWETQARSVISKNEALEIFRAFFKTGSLESLVAI